VTFPADVVLVACANPCPCGRAARECRCNDQSLVRYARRLSAPLLDRFDLRLAINSGNRERGASSADVAVQVAGAVERQRSRLHGTQWRRNAHIPAGALERYVVLSPSARAAWHDACELRSLTGRGAARIRRVARTIADLDDRTDITATDIEDAVNLREDLW